MHNNVTTLFLVLSNLDKPMFLCSVIHEILVKSQYALLLPAISKNCICRASFDDSVPFHYAVTGPSTTGDFYSMFIGA